MFTIFKIVKTLLKYLNSKESIANISISITLAILYSFIPFNLIFQPFLIFLLIILNGNLLFFLFISAIMWKVSPTLFPVFHIIGDSILTNEACQAFFVKISSIPLVNYTNWNNTVSLGGYLISIILFYPIYVVTKKVISKYRLDIYPKLKESKLLYIFKIPSWLGKLK